MIHSKIFIIAAVALVVAIGGGGSAVAQSQDKNAKAAEAAAPKTVNAQQEGKWSVGVDPNRNTVRLTNSDADPLAVKVIGSASSTRKAVQFRLAVGPTSTGQQAAHYTIPAGKRLVIENISAVARTPAGLKMELQLFSYLDNGDGVGNSGDITFHRISLVDQGVFGEGSVATANHKVLIFADERINSSSNFSLALQGRLNGTTTEFTQGQVTVSGYIEDLPTAQ